MGDFDFLVGTWDVTNRRLRQRHVGGDDWDEFAGVSEARSFFDGAGSFDEMRCPSRGFSGSTVRILNPSTGLWSIYWMHSSRGVLELPPGGRPVHRRRRHVLRRRHRRGAAGTLPVPLVGGHRRLMPLGAGVLHRR
ncbi:hypothetical protein ABZ399_20625 [Micromonospora aurantiaca]|uniref:hypothetical protein n=1 Tax=Micromonospora aurantiaca (nom. illeg.) TaxID=47850 RepID=UPI0033F72C01